MSNENPVGDKNTDHERTVSYKEYAELRAEFLAEMRENVRQSRMQGDEQE